MFYQMIRTDIVKFGAIYMLFLVTFSSGTILL